MTCPDYVPLSNDLTLCAVDRPSLSKHCVAKSREDAKVEEGEGRGCTVCNQVWFLPRTMIDIECSATCNLV